MDKAHVMINTKETNLIRRIANRIYRNYCPAGKAGSITKNDLYHLGIIGLLEARKRYDKAKKVPLLSFAAFRIEGAMVDEIRKQPMIRLPQEGQKKVKELKEAKTDLVQRGKKAGAKNLADKLGWTVKKLHKVENLPPSLIYVDAHRRDGEERSNDRNEGFTDPADNPEITALRNEQRGLVNRCLNALSPRDRFIIESRIVEGLTLREVADTLGCTLENVRLLQQKVERMMKVWMTKHDWSMS